VSKYGDYLKYELTNTIAYNNTCHIIWAYETYGMTDVVLSSSLYCKVSCLWCLTVVQIAAISPDAENYEQTLSTLRYGLCFELFLDFHSSSTFLF